MPITERVATDLPVTIKTSTYTLLPTDWGREIQFQNASAVSANLPPVADAGNGYNVVIRNIGTGTLTIDPAGSEQIDGGSTASLSAGDSLWIRADGTEWKSIASGGAGGGGTVTQVDTSGGLAGGPITTSGTVSIADGGVSTAKLADNAVTLAKMAGGTAGNLITYDASGDPAAVATGNAGDVLTSNGTGAAPTFQPLSAGGGLQSMQVFTSSGTWTKPMGITKVKVTVIGAGGGGGNTDGSQSTGDAAAGGGGGGSSIKLIDVSSISSETVTIGSGGAGSTSSGGTGSAGGGTSFGSHCSASGGSGGEGSTLNSGPGVPGNGGVGSSGDINLTGWAGTPGDKTQEYGGGGGASILGGGAPVTVNPTGTPQTGASGVTPGAGGAAGFFHSGGGSADGGDGADGIVIVEEYA